MLAYAARAFFKRELFCLPHRLTSGVDDTEVFAKEMFNEGACFRILDCGVDYPFNEGFVVIVGRNTNYELVLWGEAVFRTEDV